MHYVMCYKLLQIEFLTNCEGQEKQSTLLRAISRVEIRNGKKVPWSLRANKHSRLCSSHFISGRKSNNPSSTNYIPKLFSHKTKKLQPERKSISNRTENDANDVTCPVYKKAT